MPLFPASARHSRTKTPPHLVQVRSAESDLSNDRHEIRRLRSLSPPRSHGPIPLRGRTASDHEQTSLRSAPISQVSLTARNCVWANDINELQMLGAGELMRLAKMISFDENPSTQILQEYLQNSSEHSPSEQIKSLKPSQILVEQDRLLESKLQIAFVRALNSKTSDQGYRALDKALVIHYHDLGDPPEPLTKAERKEAIKKIVSTKGKALAGLTISELQGIKNQLQLMIFQGGRKTRKAQVQAADLMEKALDTAQRQRLSLYPRHIPERDRIESGHDGAIVHFTTFLVHVFRDIEAALGDPTLNNEHEAPGTQAARSNPLIDLTFLFLKHAHNESSIKQLRGELANTLKETHLSKSQKKKALEAYDSIAKRFKPTDNLGLQCDSPHAKALENTFSVMAMERPPRIMSQVMQKIIHQLKTPKDFAGLYDGLLRDYAALGRSYVYPPAQKELLSPCEIQKRLETGSDLLLFMDFHHFATDRIGQAPLLQSTEIPETWHKKTFAEDVISYRGARIALPRISTVQNKSGLVGVGNHTQAIALGRMQAPMTRPSTIKVSFGEHAEQSAKADTAQACGTTGRGNMHLWGQAIINEYAALEGLELSEEEVAAFIMMISSTMTADGGHTLSETIATCYFASNNALNMDKGSKKFVQDFFSKLKDISLPFTDPQTRFAHYDMVLHKIKDQDFFSFLTRAWDYTRKYA